MGRGAEGPSALSRTTERLEELRSADNARGPTRVPA